MLIILSLARGSPLRHLLQLKAADWPVLFFAAAGSPQVGIYFPGPLSWLDTAKS
jgi:hypothetical protein